MNLSCNKKGDLFQEYVTSAARMYQGKVMVVQQWETFTTQSVSCVILAVSINNNNNNNNT